MHRIGRRCVRAEGAQVSADFKIKNTSRDLPLQAQGGVFVIHVVHKGDRYGLDDRLVHSKEDPLIEIWDASSIGVRGFPDKKGQFVSRYSASTLAERAGGIDLMGYEPAWKIDSAAFAPVRALAKRLNAGLRENPRLNPRGAGYGGDSDEHDYGEHDYGSHEGDPLLVADIAKFDFPTYQRVIRRALKLIPDLIENEDERGYTDHAIRLTKTCALKARELANEPGATTDGAARKLIAFARPFDNPRFGNPDWKALGSKAKRGARAGLEHTKRAAKEFSEGWREANPRENPGELLVVNPEEFDTAKAEKVYAMWHKKNPHRASVLDTGCDGDDEMVCVGKACDIVYRSGKWEKGRKTNDYIHTFDSKPNVYMLGHLVEAGLRSNGSKSVESLLAKAKNADGQFSVAELATPLSFSLQDGTDAGQEIAIHVGAKVYGAVDKKTVIITDPHWRLIVIKGGEMHFDERGIVK